VIEHKRKLKRQSGFRVAPRIELRKKLNSALPVSIPRK